jgi:hypothetical protein
VVQKIFIPLIHVGIDLVRKVCRSVIIRIGIKKCQQFCLVVTSYPYFSTNQAQRVPQLKELFAFYMTFVVDRDNVAGIATRYGLDGPGIECRLADPSDREV